MIGFRYFFSNSGILNNAGKVKTENEESCFTVKNKNYLNNDVTLNRLNFKV